MDRIGTNISLLLIMVIVALGMICPITSGEFTYGGSFVGGEPPNIDFSIENSTVLYDLGNFNVAFIADISFPNLQTLSVALYQVTYKTSWQNNPNTIYQWSINDPANMHDDDPNPQAALFYAIDLTEVPEGFQQIEVTVLGGGYVFGGSEYYVCSTNATSILSFTISAPPSNSSIQTVDPRGTGGGLANCPIELDSDNMPHVAYTHLTPHPTYFVTYAKWNSVGWSTETVAAGSLNSFVLDANSKPHIVYGEGIRGSLTYATIADSGWKSQIIEKNIGNSYGAIALDPLGNPHVAYTDGKVVKYASRTGTIWNSLTIDTITAEYAVPFQVSIAVAQDNARHVLYGYLSSEVDNSTGISKHTVVIKLATWKNSGWNIQTIPLPSTINGYGNMALDSKGYPHFVCSQNQDPSKYLTLSNLFYVSWDGKAWNTQTVASKINLGIYSPNVNWLNMASLALDSHDYPHVTYVTSPDPESSDSNLLTYARWTGNSWKIQTTNINTQSNKPGFLALDSSDNPHISYNGPTIEHGYYSFHDVAHIMYATAVMPSVSGLTDTEILTVVVTVLVVAVAAVAGLILYRRKRKR